MGRARRLLLVTLLMLGGCKGGPMVQETDRLLLEMASRPFDVAPPESADSKPKAETASPEKNAEKSDKPTAPSTSSASEPDSDIGTVAFLQAERSSDKQSKEQPKYELHIPPGVPGSEARLLPDVRKMTPEQRQETIQRIYPELPPLPIEPVAESGPNGVSYTLADLQKMAVENSPTLRQAASDVKAAEGALAQAKTYQNPIIAYNPSPNNNNSNTGARGGFIDQHLTMWGKRALAVAAAQKTLENAQLALKRARSDLSTNVRNAYFGLIVAHETMRVNGALARFTDEIYRLYTGYLEAGVVATYEPAPLRSQAFTNRLAYKQAIINYIAAWQQLVATIGLPQLPLTEVSGRVDRLIPYYDYDKVLAYILANHTDVITARNGVAIAQYNLKLARITPIPDMDVMAGYWKEMTVAPFASYYIVTLGFPIPIWDQNKGNIMSSQAALIRAVEESHRVENALTNTLAANYANYRNNLYALEDYRRYILPDQVVYYRGVFDRREVDSEARPGDLLANLVTAQQALAANVQNYLGILGTLWTSVVSVADVIQTPDLFQLAAPRELPELPDFTRMPQWLCPHHRSAGPGVGGMPGNCCPPVAPVVKPLQLPSPSPAPAMPPADNDPQLPAPRRNDKPATLPPTTEQSRPQAKPVNLTQQLMEPPPEIPKKVKRKDESASE